MIHCGMEPACSGSILQAGHMRISGFRGLNHTFIFIFSATGSILKMSHGKRPAGKVYTKSETVEESK